MQLLLLVDIAHFAEVLTLDMRGSFSLHVIQLFLEFCRVISLDEIFVYFFDSLAEFRVIVYFGKRNLEFVVLVVGLFVLCHFLSNYFEVCF